MLFKRAFKYMMIILLLLFAYAFVEPYWMETKIVTIDSSDIPAHFDDVKIVFLTDIHHGPYFSLKRLEKLVERVNRLEPDIVLLGGDYIYRDTKYIRPLFQELAKLNATYGVYGVLGNHDHWGDPDLTRQCMAEEGIHLLDNRSYWIEKGGEKIKIGGVGDYYHGKQDLEPTINDVDDEDFVLLVTHNPDYVERIETGKIDLVLAGHTHGGQVTFFGLWAPVIPSAYGQKYRTGTIDMGNMKVIVSNGIGTIFPPARFFARPQIVVAVLKSGK